MHYFYNSKFFFFLNSVMTMKIMTYVITLITSFNNIFNFFLRLGLTLENIKERKKILKNEFFFNYI